VFVAGDTGHRRAAYGRRTSWSPVPVDCRSGGPYIECVSTHTSHNREEHLEQPVEELLRRARPLPTHDEMVIEDLTEEEGAAFLAAVDS
jgi:hypothetical protein